MVRLPGLGTRPFSQKGSRSTVPVYRPRGSIEQEQARAARQQEELVQHNILDRSPGQPPKTMVTAASWIREPFIWSSPAARAYRLPLLRPMFANVYANCAKFRRKRVVVDSVISEEEARVYTHDAKDAHGDPLFQIDEMFGVDAECSTAFQDWPDNPLNQEIPDRIRFLIRRHFSEKRPLHLVGAMLRRTRPGGECGYDRGPTICHVDKANISYYDYSAILYLSTKGTDFEGGQLAFNDPCRDELVEPRLGRCVMFASGPHHLHQAKAVTSGTRMIMAMWYSLNCKLHGEQIHMVCEARSEERR